MEKTIDAADANASQPAARNVAARKVGDGAGLMETELQYARAHAPALRELMIDARWNHVDAAAAVYADTHAPDRGRPGDVERPLLAPKTAALFDIVTVPCWRAGTTIWPVPSVVPALL